MLGNMLTRNGALKAGKGTMRAGREYNDMNHIGKNFYVASCIKQNQDY